MGNRSGSVSSSSESDTEDKQRTRTIGTGGHRTSKKQPRKFTRTSSQRTTNANNNCKRSSSSSQLASNSGTCTPTIVCSTPDDEPTADSNSASNTNVTRSPLATIGERKASYCPRPSQCSLTLTKAQAQHIQRMWALRNKRHCQNAGAAIFSGIFTQAPEAKSIFEQRNATIERHYVFFQNALDTIIANLDDQEKLDAYLDKLGRTHAIFREEGFESKLWKAFGDSMVQLTFQWDSIIRRNGKLQQAWCDAVLYIIDRMREGYYSELRLPSDGRKVSIVPSFVVGAASRCPSLRADGERPSQSSSRKLSSHSNHQPTVCCPESGTADSPRRYSVR